MKGMRCMLSAPLDTYYSFWNCEYWLTLCKMCFLCFSFIVQIIFSLPLRVKRLVCLLLYKKFILLSLFLKPLNIIFKTFSLTHNSTKEIEYWAQRNINKMPKRQLKQFWRFDWIVVQSLLSSFQLLRTHHFLSLFTIHFYTVN